MLVEPLPAGPASDDVKKLVDRFLETALRERDLLASLG